MGPMEIAKWKGPWKKFCNFPLICEACFWQGSMYIIQYFYEKNNKL